MARYVPPIPELAQVLTHSVVISSSGTNVLDPHIDKKTYLLGK